MGLMADLIHVHAYTLCGNRTPAIQRMPFFRRTCTSKGLSSEHDTRFSLR